ncbi:MAG TPA: RNA polymerase sigma factor [Kofleriaceae bacterium]|nr:RNA polymerase sigma factor [Kofleriaceae bacterium]
MERYAAGQDAAFGDLYDALGPRLLGFLRRQVHDDGLAEDLVQQTFLQIHRARGQFIRGAEVVPWAFAIARNQICDTARRRRAESSVAIRDGNAEAIDRRPSTEPSADEVLHAREVASRLEDEMSRLPASQRIAFELIKQEGLSLAQAAAVLGITVTAVKLRAHRAYVALRAALGDLENEGVSK